MPPQAPATGLRAASWDDVISAVAKQHGVNPLLAIAVAKKESSLNPRAIGDSGDAVGMFQLHVPAAEDMGLSAADRSDPLKNITGGIKYLKTLSDRYQGDVSKALMAYNGGMDNVDKGTVSSAAQAYAAEVIASLSQNMRETSMAGAGARLGPPAAPSNVRVASSSAPAVRPTEIDLPGQLEHSPVVQAVLGASKGLLQTAYTGLDLVRRPLGMAPLAQTPEARAAVAPTNTAQQIGKFAEEIAEFAIPGTAITKITKGARAAAMLVKAGVSPPRALMVGRAVTEGSAQAAAAAGITTLRGEDPTAAVVLAGAAPVAAQMVSSMAPVLRRQAVTRLARFLERGVPGHVTPEMERHVLQAAGDFIDLPLQRTWRQTARMTKARRGAAGQTLATALAGPLGDAPVPVRPILNALDDLVVEAQHLIPAGAGGELRTITYKTSIPGAVGDLKSLLQEYDDAFEGLVPARYLHDLKQTWQAAIYGIREGAKPAASTRELLTSAQKEAYQRGSTAIMDVLKADAPVIAALDRAVSHAAKLDQFIKRIAAKARTSSLATQTAKHAIGVAGGAAGFLGGSALGHPFIGAGIGGFTSRLLLNAIQSPRWRLTPAVTRRRLADALARGSSDQVRQIVQPIVLATTAEQDNILTTVPAATVSAGAAR